MNEPIEYHLARIEAAAALMTDIPPCIHCRSGVSVLSWHAGTDLPRAIEIKHQPGCPADDIDGQGAAEYEVEG